MKLIYKDKQYLTDIKCYININYIVCKYKKYIIYDKQRKYITNHPLNNVI